MVVTEGLFHCIIVCGAWFRVGRHFCLVSCWIFLLLLICLVSPLAYLSFRYVLGVPPLQLGTLPGSSAIASVPLVAPATTVVTSAAVDPRVSNTVWQPTESGPVVDARVPPPGQSGLSLSLAVEPIPARLVARILSGQFIEMRNLLGDNISLAQRLEEIHTSFPVFVLPVSSRPRLREVSTLPSWLL